MRFCSLSSGSKQNCFYIESGNEAILIDAGIAYKRLLSYLEMIGRQATQIKAIFITHEHGDHVRGLKRIAASIGVPVYIHSESRESLNFELENWRELIDGVAILFGGIEILPFEVTHDAINTFGFMVSDGDKNIFLASDVGMYDDKLIEFGKSADLVAIEANYDPEMLRTSMYHYALKKRIQGNNGHLSNNDSVGFLDTIMNGRTKNVVFLHLSENNNHPNLLRNLVMEELREKHSEVKFWIAGREKPTELIDV
jgi:phosphoribosyl 1,2-cyclic phosphodiesterase